MKFKYQTDSSLHATNLICNCKVGTKVHLNPNLDQSGQKCSKENVKFCN